MYNKTQVKPLGKIKTEVYNPKNKKHYELEFLVTDQTANPLLGSIAIQKMDLITVNQENIYVCEELLTKESMLRNYKDVFAGEGKLEGNLHLEIDKSVTPVKLPVRRVPLAIKPKLKKEIDRLTSLGIIQPVDIPTDWISAMVVVMKRNGRVRLCIDPKPLNTALKRNHYPLPVIEDILPSLANAKVFTVMDAKNGFWQVQLDTKSSMLTTFETPWGKYRWLRMPMGIAPAPEEFQRRLNNTIRNLDGVLAVADDILIYGVGDTEEEAIRDHDRKLTAFMERCREKNLKINRDKMKLRESSVLYLGHRITAEGVRVDESKVEAIKDMTRPSDKKAVMRLLGMVNYVREFIPRLSEISEPLRNLTKKDTEFVWNETHEESFERIKMSLMKAPVLKYFSEKEPVTLQCDSSEKGIGACLFQQNRPVLYHSRALTQSEINYAQIEKELLAVVSAVDKFHTYIYGRHVIIETDHKPLEAICKKSLTSAPKRLQHMLLQLQKYDLEVIYKKGTEMYFADTLSRAYLKKTESKQQNFEVVNSADYLPVSERAINQIQKAMKNDPEMTTLMNLIQAGWPETPSLLNDQMKIYFTFRDELIVQDGLIYKGDRLVIPAGARSDIINKLHAAHIGIQGTQRRAREAAYWPKMNEDLQNEVSKCSVCNEFAQAQAKEPLIVHKVPDRPWAKIACDLFDVGDKHYLLTVDFYSNFFEVDKLSNKTSSEVIYKLKQQLARHGLPNTLISDNGPPFNSADFAEFAELYDFEHITSSPGFAQSNGKAENAIKTAKRLLSKAKEDKKDPYLSLLDWRNTPSEGLDCSPCQRLFSRRTRTRLPLAQKLLKPKVSENVQDKLMKRKELQTKYYNVGAKDLASLKVGEVVRIKPFGYSNRWIKARVEGQADIRSYNVRTEDGRLYRRNRKHLRRTAETKIVRPNSSMPLLPKPVNQQASSENNKNLEHPIPKPQTVSSPIEPNMNKDSNMSKSTTVTKQPVPIKDIGTTKSRYGRVIKKPNMDNYVCP